MDAPMIPSGGGLGSRPLHFFWICDCSGSMSTDGKIQQLNTAIKEAIPHLQKVADDNPNADVQFQVITVSSDVQWKTMQPVKIKDFQWNDLYADGETYMGKALRMVADRLQTLPPRGLPPVLVLITDGQPTDDFNDGLNVLMSTPWGKKSVRIAIAIGDDCDLNVLQKFIGNTEKRPITVKKIDDLVRQIRLSSTVALKEAAEQVAPAPASTGTQGEITPAPAPVSTSPTGPAPMQPQKDPNKPEDWVW